MNVYPNYTNELKSTTVLTVRPAGLTKSYVETFNWFGLFCWSQDLEVNETILVLSLPSGFYNFSFQSLLPVLFEEDSPFKQANRLGQNFPTFIPITSRR